MQRLVGGDWQKKTPKNILMEEILGEESVYLGGNMMPQLQDIIHIYIQCPFFCWNAETRENFSLNLAREQCGL